MLLVLASHDLAPACLIGSLHLNLQKVKGVADEPAGDASQSTAENLNCILLLAQFSSSDARSCCVYSHLRLIKTIGPEVDGPRWNFATCRCTKASEEARYATLLYYSSTGLPVVDFTLAVDLSLALEKLKWRIEKGADSEMKVMSCLNFTLQLLCQ